MTALTGISALAYFVVADVSRTFASLSDFAIAFLPRLSIIVIIEMFSYFFLRLYKSSLSEIKYFQNEATNIEFNFVALESALHLQDAPLIHKALEHFIRVERNPILRTGQSTREIEDAKQLDSALKWTPAQFAEILKVLSPNRTAEPPQK